MSFYLQLILSNGCIVSISLSGHCGDVENVVLDKSMIGKFSTGTVSHGLYCCLMMVCTVMDICVLVCCMTSMDNNRLTVGVFVDLEKASDTAKHKFTCRNKT